MAAVLAGGPNAVLSHRAAASLLGLLPATGKLEVIRSSSPDRHRPPPEHASRQIHPGLVIHRTRRLTRREIWRRKGIPVTSAVRTMINLAEREDPGTLRTAIRRGISRGMFTAEELVRELDRTRGRRGIRKLRSALDDWDPSQLRTRSELEAGFIDLCRDYGLPKPYVNDRRNDHEVDFQWEGSYLVVEVDGGAYHSDRKTRHRDYRKSLDLNAAGMRVVRCDEQMIFAEAAETAVLLRLLLAKERETRRDIQPASPQTVAVSDRDPP